MKEGKEEKKLRELTKKELEDIKKVIFDNINGCIRLQGVHNSPFLLN